MRKSLEYGAVFVSVGLTLFLTVSDGIGQLRSDSPSSNRPQLRRHVEGEVLVKFKSHVQAADKQRFHREADVDVASVDHVAFSKGDKAPCSFRVQSFRLGHDLVDPGFPSPLVAA